MMFESKTETARKAITDVLEAAALCLTHEKVLPGVCLVLIAIDTMSTLSRPAGTAHGRRHFVEWVDKYLLPGSGLPCTALEIYAARCGLLHSQSPRSELGEAGQVRDIWYALGPATASGLQAAADKSLRSGRVVGVQLEQLLQAVQAATLRFGMVVNLDLELEKLVEERSMAMFTRFTSEVASESKAAKGQ
jgi:hypothetical protein